MIHDSIGRSTNPRDVRALKPNAREVFALRPRHSEERTHPRTGATRTVVVTDAWPEGSTPEHVQGALVQAGWRR